MTRPPREVLDFLAALTDAELAATVKAARATLNDDGLLSALESAVGQGHGRVIDGPPPLALNDNAGLRAAIGRALKAPINDTQNL